MKLTDTAAMLPRYPLPDLEVTLKEIRRVISTTLKPTELSSFDRALQEEMSNLQKIHQEFISRHQNDENWATTQFKNHLLSLRLPIPQSTCIPLLLRPATKHLDQISYASALLWAVANIKVKGLLKSPGLESTQINELFSSCRTPGLEKDNIQTHLDSRHAVILYKGIAKHIFIVDEAGQPIPIETIREDIAKVVKFVPEKSQLPVCQYSAYGRHKWHQLREQVAEEPLLKCMERSIVCLSLEVNDCPSDYGKALNVIRFGREGSESSRYYDKVFQIVVFTDCVAGTLFEHSAVDGMVAVSVSEMLRNITESLSIDENEKSTSNPSEIIEKEPKSSGVIEYFDYHTFPDVLTTLTDEKVYDSWINFSLQMTLSKALPDRSLLMVAPCHVRHFQNGRCDPIFSVTSDSFQLIESFKEADQLFDLFSTAFEENKRLVRSAKKGQAVGPFIYALRTRLQQINPSSSLLPFLGIFGAPNIYLTGKHSLDDIESVQGNVYAEEQLVVTYLGRKDGVRIILSARGSFADQIQVIKERFQESLHKMLRVAIKYAVASQMKAIQAYKVFKQLPNESSLPFKLVLHGGAGEEKTVFNPEVEELLKFALRLALAVGVESLRGNDSSLNAVVKVVRALEDCFLFNAGKGSVYNEDGQHELEASVMDGETGNSGSVACVENIKNPISAARLVMEKSRFAFLTGKSAEKLAEENSLDLVQQSYFGTDLRFKQFCLVKAMREGLMKHPQTVGAVAIDSSGRLAAASSTGGVLNKSKGRVGDTAIIGAGIIANSKVAVACTGDGEVFIKSSVASKVSNLYEHSRKDLKSVCHEIISEDIKESYGGLIALSSNGELAIETNATMFVASFDGKNQFVDINKGIKTDQVEYVIWENERHIAHLHTCPQTPLTTVLMSRQKNCHSIFDLPESDYLAMMLDARILAKEISQRIPVERCAMITKPEEDGVPRISLIPLHGLGTAWEACLACDNEFNDEFPGYCTSKNGPRCCDEELNKMQSTIRGASSEYVTSNRFDGSPDDNNLFAKIVRGEVVQWRVWEDDDHIAFLTPFPSCPGFTVLISRSHLPSDIFALEEEDYIKLLKATYELSKLMRTNIKNSSCAMMFEGYEIDYAHAKLIPIVSDNPFCKSNCLHYYHKYEGHISTMNGPLATKESLIESFKKLAFIRAPKSWQNPESHSQIAMKDPWYSNVFLIQNTLFHSTVEYFSKITKYAYVLTPLTTDSISSPMGIGSDSLPVRVNLLGQDIYLADSMQFLLEYYLRLKDGLAGTYYVSPSFRGEDPDASHLNQFYQIECELVGDLDDAINVAEKYIHHVTSEILKEHRSTIMSIAGRVDHIETLLSKCEGKKKFPRITFKDALKILPDPECYEDLDSSKPGLGSRITRKGELFLIQRYGGPVWLTEFDHLSVPFYQAYTDDTRTTARAADLLFGIGETLGLGERHDSPSLVEDALNQQMVPIDAYKWYIDIRKNKMLKTSGWGIGVERYISWILQHDDIRDIQIVPKLKGLKSYP